MEHSNEKTPSCVAKRTTSYPTKMTTQHHNKMKTWQRIIITRGQQTHKGSSHVSYTHTYIHIHIHMHVHVHVHIHALLLFTGHRWQRAHKHNTEHREQRSTQIHTRVTYICIFIYIYVRIYTHIHTHTHIQIHTSITPTYRNWCKYTPTQHKCKHPTEIWAYGIHATAIILHVSC